MSINARVLLLARDDRFAAALSEGLDRLGWRSITARSLPGALIAMTDLDLEAVVLDATEHGIDRFAEAARLKAEAAPRRLPVLALGEDAVLGISAGVDVVLAPPVHPAQLAARLDALVRAAVADEELELRRATLAAHGDRLAPATDNAPLRVLTVGEPAPKFLALTHALRAEGVETVGAFTPYTTFDYLHEERFDAVVLWAGETHAEALSIASGMRRNTRLYHIPTMLYLRSGVETPLGAAYDRGLTDVASAEVEPAQAALRALSLARAFRRESLTRRALESARGSALMEDGLFPRDLFAAHLARLTETARKRRRPLSVAMLRVADSPELAFVRRSGALERALPQIGAMVGRLVRAEDTVGRLSPEVFALALPATRRPEAQSAADRIAAVIACTAFEAGEGRTPFALDLDVGVAEVKPGEGAAAALERAAGDSLSRKAG